MTTNKKQRKKYEENLKEAGADLIIESLNSFNNQITPLFIIP